MDTRLFVMLLLMCLTGTPAYVKNAQVTTIGKASDIKVLRHKLEEIISPYNASTGLALRCIEDGDTLSINNEHRYPMQSVYKFCLALDVLHAVDQGKLSLSKKIRINKRDLHQTWSPLRRRFPDGNIDLTIGELLNYTVSLSDNNTCDILFALMKGTKHVQSYMRECGIQDIAIVATEHEMHRKWSVQYTNWCKPRAMIVLLDGFYQGKYLSASSTTFLMKLMTESSNPFKRIKGLLPEGTIVAHKTGTSGANDDDLSAATNDVGIISLPDGKHIAIAVFVTNSKESLDVDEHIIAEVSKAVYDYFSQKEK